MTLFVASGGNDAAWCCCAGGDRHTGPITSYTWHIVKRNILALSQAQIYKKNQKKQTLTEIQYQDASQGSICSPPDSTRCALHGLRSHTFISNHLGHTCCLPSCFSPQPPRSQITIIAIFSILRHAKFTSPLFFFVTSCFYSVGDAVEMRRVHQFIL